MKLWLLRAREDLTGYGPSNPWNPWYDKAFGFVIRAETEEEARKIATQNGGDELTVLHDDGNPAAWLASRYSTCEELLPEGESGVILKDFSSA